MKKEIFKIDTLENLKNLHSAKRALAAFKHPIARDVIKLLVKEERQNVTQIMFALRKEQATISQILATMRRHKLVTSMQEGKFIYYEIDERGLSKIERLMTAIGRGENWEQMSQSCFDTIRALAQIDRLRIVEFIAKAETTNVAPIYNKLKLEQSICSNHLRILRKEDFVTSKVNAKSGKKRDYRAKLSWTKRVIDEATRFNHVEKKQLL